ncbi:hypothetical protein ACFCXH_18460 [Streptomyces nojiriensis]|uniref:Secreted protein n=1 Tax=Streptomyces nojiriensis TaxID=66374 RepID=A0ABQ3SX07_9ACTN|nr:hypothetical protein [Streptomyces nojiriensis]QTI45978.1 ESX-1 secretion-associated protein EspE [Streptomyces nojiriensis]GGR89033.1 hypothetical protein GCM10010205_16870 [Streptomyces nojiriensis]GHI72452.1 hypothetical protein Snoj_63700 [Streptomyces nojiriensis]
MRHTKPSRARLLVPSALAVVILSGAAAPAGAAEADGSGAPSGRVASVQRQAEKIERRAKAGPIDDLLSGLTKTLQDLLASVGGLLPDGVKLPPIELPKLPDIKLPELPDLSGLIPELPPVDGLVPELPAAPEVPVLPELPVTPTVPEVPALPAVP